MQLIGAHHMFTFDHVSIAVTDSDRSARFYADVFGGEITRRQTGDKLTLISMQVGGQTIELLQYQQDAVKNRTTGIIDHIAFTVPDIELEVQRLKELNIPLAEPTIRQLPNGKKIIFLLGPDGERIELVQP
jgi:lactoylglutathione lyase